MTQAPAQARQIDDSLLQSLQWRCIGPPRGGRVVAVAGDPVNRATFYFGACAGGVWKTEDGGTYWENVSDGFFETAAVGAIAVAESDPNVVYAGMGEACIRLDVTHGDGVYRSTDAGKTWTHLGLEDTRHISRVRVHPTDPDTVFVAALGHAFGPNQQRGVFKSTDGGQNWKHVLFVSENAGAADLSIDPTNPRIMYASIWQTYRDFWSLTSGGPDSGLWKSVDGGETWEDITGSKGFPEGLKGKIGVAASGARSGLVYATVEHEKGRSVQVVRRRQALEHGQRRPGPAGPSLVLPARIRGPRGVERSMDSELPVLEVGRWRKNVLPGEHAARRQPRPLDRPERH